MIKAIDISKHQGTFDARRAKAAGIQQVILRAGYGNFKDVRFDRFAAECKAAGMPTGAYQFLTWHYRNKNNGSPAQARQIMQSHTQSLLEILSGSGVTGWVALDQELESGQAMGLDAANNTQLLNEAADKLRAAGYHPCMYCSASWARDRVLLDKLNMPLWLAYYYADPNDPDFASCKAIEQVNAHWARWMAGLGDKLCGWQYGRIGYGAKYGVGSTNVDRNWIYFLPEEMEEKPMKFEKITGKQLKITSAERPACQAFAQPDVNDTHYTNLALRTYPITAQGDTVELGGMTATWYQIEGAAQPYVLALPDRCQVQDAPAPQPEPAPGKVRVVLELTVSQLRMLADSMEGK